jgi:putative Mg2+ transporter-C (MgtC) family protein
VGLAAVFGGLVGIEREWAGKPAGLRTHMIVCAVAALLMSLGRMAVAEFSTQAFSAAVRADPLRIIQATILGVSFLGAGTIFVHRPDERIQGLTTAANVLLVTAIGLATGLGMYVVAGGVTLISAAILLLVRLVEMKISVKRHPHGGGHATPPATPPEGDHDGS